MNESSELLQVIKVRTAGMLNLTESLFALSESIAALAAAVTDLAAKSVDDNIDLPLYLDGSNAQDS